MTKKTAPLQAANESFAQIKERIIKKGIEKSACVYGKIAAEASETHEQLLQVIKDNVWWCVDNDVVWEIRKKLNTTKFTSPNPYQ